jgi:hypothetical protein
MGLPGNRNLRLDDRDSRSTSAAAISTPPSPKTCKLSPLMPISGRAIEGPPSIGRSGQVACRYRSGRLSLNNDMFDLPFDEIAPIVGRSPTATRQLASRARRRVKGAAAVPDADLTRQRDVVDAFLAAARGGDFDALVAALDPDVVLRADGAAVPPGAPRGARGAPAVAKRALAFSERARFAQAALVNGAVGLVVAPQGRLLVVLGFTITRGRIVEIDVIADPLRHRQLELAVLHR